jgi:ABC-2 type transport system permease protein
MNGIWAIVVLDMQRFFKERVRLIAGLIQPLLYLFVLGSGIGASMRMGPPSGAPGGAAAFDYRAFIYPGVMSLALLFSATFAGITIVFDRQIGFFKAVLVAPVPRSAIGIGKVVSGALQALIQGTILLIFLPFMKIEVSFMTFVWVVPAMVLAALTFSSIGVAMAARFTSTNVFPILTNAIMLPMFFLSGAMYPLQPAPVWMQRLAHLDPVAYAVDLLRGALLGREHMFFGNPVLSVAVLCVCIVVLTWSAVKVFSRGEELDLTGPTKFTWRK